ncbi:MAG TPA: autotransporter-associated beta strand repeat-containing protein, partial [Pirellulales bacterium]|jgi:autotransporter-associated beta strand protein
VLTKNGSGSVTLTSNNTYSGGTTLNAGTLNVNSAGALGSGPLTLNGGTLDNTFGALTLASNPAQSWAGNFTFGGTNDLNLGSGGVTLTNSRTVTTNNSGRLTVGGVISGASNSLTKNGTGTLTLTNKNTYGGGTIVNGGILELGSGGGTGTIGGTLTINNGGTVRTLVTDSIGFTAGLQVNTVTLNAGGTFDAYIGGNEGFDTNFVMNGGTVQSTSGGRINFDTGFGISTNPASGNSTFSAPISIRGSALPIDVEAGSNLNLFTGFNNGTGNGTVTKTGAGTLTFGSGNAFPTAPLVFNGGVVATGGFSQSSTGTLQLASNSTLDLGPVGSNATVSFGDSSALAWSGTLTIANWSAGANHLIMIASPTGLTSAQLGDIKFADFAHQGASLVTSPAGAFSFGEVVPTIGDIDQNGVVNASDLNELMIALTNFDVFKNSLQSQNPLLTDSDLKYIVDVNLDGSPDNADIQAEIFTINAALAPHAPGLGNGSAVPEPASIALLGIGAFVAGFIAYRRRMSVQLSHGCNN